MKIIALTLERLTGVFLYRTILPHHHLGGKHNTEIRFCDPVSLKLMSDEEVAGYDMIHSSYTLWDSEDTSRIKRLKVKLVIDIDDYWITDRFHESYEKHQKNERTKKIIALMKVADAITTTTQLLKEKILPFNSKVAVLGNALMDGDYVMPVTNKVPLVGWIGGGQHTADLMTIQHLQKGFNIPIYIPENYRQIFKDRFLYYEGKDVPEYLGIYNHYEIIIAPLRKSKFNSFKSPLKLIEGGMYEKAMIVADVDPFREYLSHKNNCLVVKKKSEWGKFLKMLVNDKAMRYELGQNLKKDILREFNIDTITDDRLKFYKDVIGS